MSLQRVATAAGADLQGGAPASRLLRVVTDSRAVLPGDLFVAIRGERFDGHAFLAEASRRGAVASLCDRRARSLVQNQVESFGAMALLFVEDTIESLGRLAAEYRRHVMDPATTVLAVTGSNGKTTTKQLIHHVLSTQFAGRCSPKSYNNHIGVPLTLLSADADDRYLVVEIGSNARGEVAHLAGMTAPNVAMITSVGEAHLAGLGKLEAVAAEKASLLDHLAHHGLAIINSDSPELSNEVAHRSGLACVTVGRRGSPTHKVGSVCGTLTDTTCTVSGFGRVRLPIPGLHQAMNAALAMAAAAHVGMRADEIIARLASFKPADGRACTMDIGGVTVVDDTYNANPTSVSAAVATLARVDCRRRVFVLGDMRELGDESASLHRRVVRQMADARIDLLVAVGRKAAQAAGEVKNEGVPMTVVTCDHAPAAGDVLARLLAPGDAVWIKGSRATELERIIERIRGRVGVRAMVV